MALIAAAAHLILLAGCNTIHGVGEDVEAAGDALQDAAD
ncbi:MAG: entericidin A/B family lipoprotein [Phycisphaerales bacterium]|nr:entericidin A/B family lipoprotein [Phycisphaerales bacterium]